MAERILSRGSKPRSPQTSPPLSTHLHGLLSHLQTAEAAVATAACALDAKSADELPEIARTLRRCAGDALFQAIQTVEALLHPTDEPATEGADATTPADDGDSIRAMESEVHKVLCKLTCADQVLWDNEAVDRDEEAGRARVLVRDCVKDLERILKYAEAQS